MRKTVSKTVRYLYIASVLALVAALLAIGGWFSWQWWFKNSESNLANRAGWDQTLTGTDLSASAQAGDVIGIIRIPKIGLTSYMIEMADTEDKPNLDRGVGHVHGTGWPGVPGNAVFAGHRVTFAHPFLHIDQIVPGDLIEVETPDRIADYRMTEFTIVTPDRVDVMDPTTEPTITLISCHPPHSAEYRYIVKGTLERVDVKIAGQGAWPSLSLGLQRSAAGLRKILPTQG